MTINKKYSYNGYDPNSQEIKDKKAELLFLYDQRILNKKEYSALIMEMKIGWKKKSLVDASPEEFSNTEIVNSCFAQEEPFTDGLPGGVTNCTLTHCHLGNCNIPSGFTLNNSFNKHYKTQNDLEYWEVDEALNSIKPLSPKQYDRFSLSKDPNDLPVEKMKVSIIDQAERNKALEDRKARIKAIASDEAALSLLVEEGGEL